MKVLRNMLFLALAVFANVSVFASEVSAPVWKEGYTWVYRVTPADGPQRSRTDQVVGVGADGFTVRIEEAGMPPREAFHLMDGSLRTETTQFYQFPLTVGKKWNKSFEYVGARNGEPYRAVSNVSVVAVESVRTPAGTFGDAVKIVATMDYTRVMNGYRGRLMETVWYSPKVMKMIRYESHDSGSNRRQVVELEKYKLDESVALVQ